MTSGNSESASDAVAHVGELLGARFATFRAAYERLLASIAGNGSEKPQLAADASAALSELMALIPDGRRPAWMARLHRELKGYSNGAPDAGTKLVRAIINSDRQIGGQQWDYLLLPSAGEDVGGFDFDALFVRYRSESRLDGLFQQLLEGLDAILRCEEVDSIKLQQQLDAYVRTVRRNRQSGILAAVGVVEFGKVLFKNAVWQYASKLWGIGPLVEAVRETLDAMEVETVVIRDKAHAAITSSADASIAALPAFDAHMKRLGAGGSTTDENVAEQN